MKMRLKKYSKLTKLIFAAVAALSASHQPAIALAPESGFFMRNGTGAFVNPTANQTLVFDISTKQWKFYNGTAWQTLDTGASNLTATVSPAANNDNTQGYTPGSVWIDTTHQASFICLNSSTGAAVWAAVSPNPALFVTADNFSDYLVSGLVGSVPASSLTMITPTGVIYSGGLRLAPSPSTYTYPINSDVYDYFQTNGTFNHIAVSNGAPSPTGQPGLLIQKVVTNGTVITGVTSLAQMSPIFSVANATAGSHAVNRTTGDARYAPISPTGVSQSGNQALLSPDGSSGLMTARSIVNNDLPILSIAKGGTNNASLPVNNMGLYYADGTKFQQMASPTASQKPRCNAAGTALEWATDTNGTVTSVGVAFTSVPWLANASPITTSGNIPITIVCSKGSIPTGTGSNTSSMLSVGTDGLPLVANSGAANGLNYAVLGLSGGGSNNGSLAATANTLAAFDGSKMVNGPVMTSLQSTRLNAAGTALEAFTPAAASTTAGFGGGGSAGAIAYSTNQTFTGPTQTNATTWTTSATAAITADGPYIINTTGTFNLASGTSITINPTGGVGGIPVANFILSGTGPGGGHDSYTTSVAFGGGGAGYGGVGGNGGGLAAGFGGGTYPFTIAGGSGGASGSNGTGTGGNGGGSLFLCNVGATTIAGNITIKGGTQSASAGNGGGGGSGGSFFCGSQTSIAQTAGTIDTSGGAGQNGASTSFNAGGGGGAGRQIYMSPSNTLSGTRTSAGGAAGTTSAAAAAAGSASTPVSITGTPNLPLLGWIMSPAGLNEIDRMVAEKGPDLNGSDVIRKAAGNDIQKYFTYKFERQTSIKETAQILNIGDSNETGDNIS